MFILIAVSSYSAGLAFEVAANGDDSKFISLVQKGTIDQRWLPFFLSSSLASASNYETSVPFFSNSMGFLQNAELEVVVDLVENGYVDFVISVIHTEDVNGKPILRNDITECIFQTDGTVTFDTCVICQLLDENGDPSADGQKFLPGIQPNVPITIPITNMDWENDRDVRLIHGVKIVICDKEGGGEGCTPGYWKQSQHFGSWPIIGTGFDGTNFVTIDPVVIEGPGATHFSEVFGVTVVITLGGDPHTNVPDPTLLEALQATGHGVGPLVRHATAAWLNAESTVLFDFSSTGVIDLFNQALMDGEFDQAIKNQLQNANELGCPLGLDPLESEVIAFSETGGVDPAGYTGGTATPFEKKMYAQSELNTLLTQTTDPITIAELNNAITDLDAIVNNLDYWVNDYHLDIITGQFVLDNSKSAVLALIAITTSSEPAAFITSVDNVINELVSADMILAQTAVDDVLSCGASNPKIANHLSNAQTKLTQAQDDANQKKYDMAIQKFYDAWLEAFLATESCPVGYWTELDGYSVVDVGP